MTVFRAKFRISGSFAVMKDAIFRSSSPEDARNWVEYCNCPAGTRYADLRAANDHPEPYGVKLWCLGNEMDGPWQLGHVPADQYVIRARQAAKMMKDADRSIELVACGSSGPGLKTFAEWDQAVLAGLGNLADYVSLHRYVGNRNDDTPAYLAVTAEVDRQIEAIDAVCRAVQARRKTGKRAYLCFDEWNIWYKNREMDGAGKIAPHLIEEVYNLEDALVAAGFLHSFVRHADAVKIANLAQIVNVIAPIQTREDELLIQSIFFPFAMFSKRRDGVALDLRLDCPEYPVSGNLTAPLIDASAILGDGVLHVFLTNRDLAHDAEISIGLADASIGALRDGEIVTGPDPKAANAFEEPDNVTARPFDAVHLHGGRATVSLPPLAFAAVSLELT